MIKKLFLYAGAAFFDKSGFENHSAKYKLKETAIKSELMNGIKESFLTAIQTIKR
jgi:hypothetical protein